MSTAAVNFSSSPSTSPPLLGKLPSWGVCPKVRYTSGSPVGPTPSSSSTSPKPLRGARARWFDDRLTAAETRIIEIIRSISTTATYPVACLPLRDEPHKNISDTGLLDHLLKHDLGKLVTGGLVHLHRRHNPNRAGVLDRAEGTSADVVGGGDSDPFWVLLPGWKVGDATTVYPYEEDCEKEASELGAEVASMRRHYQSLLLWKNTVDKDKVTISCNLLAMQCNKSCCDEGREVEASQVLKSLSFERLAYNLVFVSFIQGGAGLGSNLGSGSGQPSSFLTTLPTLTLFSVCSSRAYTHSTSLVES